ncbi:MAG TPA: Arm DNA-binding domain-containing protein, partial [Thermomicrobiales bacterium]|nr:Arm DNA-binding domain-containing protein [Thermomicrobiales bacterium]
MAILRRVSKATGKASYQVMVDRRDPATGKRKRLVIGTFGTKKEAQAAERTALVQKDRGTLIDPSKTTIAELLDSWLANKRGAISSNSAWDYEAAIRLYLRPALGMMAPRDLTPDLLQGQYVSWQAAGVSPRMLHRLHLVLSQALGEAVRFDRIARNVAREVRKPSIQRRRANVWTADEVRRFLEAADGNRLSPLWHLL